MIDSQTLVFVLFLIFSGAALLSTAALFTRQSLLVAYIALGFLFGPWGLGFVPSENNMAEVGDVGIVFLLFLLGLHLHPQNLVAMLKKVSWIALVSSLLFAVLSYGVAYLFNLSHMECFVVAMAMMFSSTIVGLKLLPTTVLHHQHTGELMISVLLMQDIIAIVVLLVLQSLAKPSFGFSEIGVTIIGLPLLLVIAYVVQRFVIIKLMERFDKVQEYLFMLSIGWCLGMTELAHFFGLSGEIGAFIAGVAIAAHPISLYIAESLKPLRDFFLVMFFFSIGAGFNFSFLPSIVVPALILAAIALIIKPIVFKTLFRQVNESTKVSWEVGVRLGQASEFSLLVVYLAASGALISEKVSYLVQAATIITFIISCYFVVYKYPTPLSLTEKLHKD